MAERSDYVKTGNSAVTRFANKLSLVPIVRSIPIVNSTLHVTLGVIGTLVDAGRWLLRGKVGSAATELAAGIVGHGVNAITGPVWWIGQLGIAGFSGHTVGTHARKITEDIIGGVTGALGIKPQVLRSYPAGIGAVPGAGTYFQQQGPGQWASRASQEKGKDPNQEWQQYRNGVGREHVAALQDAASRPQTRGI